MGKIPVYSSNQLASSAVGIPSQDRSGQIIGESVGQTSQTVAAFMGERERKANDLASDAVFSDYAIAYGTGKGKAMALYRNKPDKFPAAVRDHGNQLIDQFTKDMEPGVADSFRKKATSFVTQDSLNSVQWARQRDQEIIVGNIQKVYADLEFYSQQAQTPEALKAVLDSIEQHSVKSQAFLDFSSDKILKDRTIKAAKENAMSGFILSNARQAEGDILRGKYDGILDPLEKKQYYKMAQSAAIYDATVEQYRTLTTAGAQVSEMSERLDRGELPIAEVNQQIEWLKLHENEVDINGEKIVSPHTIEAMQILKERVMKQDIRTPAEKNVEAEAFQKTWEAAWNEYLLGKDKQSKAPFRDSRKAGILDYNDVIGMYTKALKANQLGIISDARFATIRKIMDTQLKAKLGGKNMSASISDALGNAATKKLGFWSAMWNPKENIYSAGYNLIGEHFKNRKDLSIADRQTQIEHLLVKYTQAIDEMPQEKKDQIQNAEKAATDILKGYDKDGKHSVGLLEQFQVIKDPTSGEVYHVGQTITVKGNKFMVTGMKPNGEPTVRPIKVK